MKFNKYKIKNALMVAASTILSSFATTTAYAEGETSGISKSLETIAGNILTQARNIILPILAVMIVYYGVKIVISPDPKTVAEAKKGALICFIGAIIVYAAPIIYATIAEAVKGTGENSTFTFSANQILENNHKVF